MNKRSYEELLKYIGIGEENAISCISLSIMCGLSERNTQSQVQKARRDGVIICSNEHGYFYPEDNEELRSFYRRLRCGALTTLSVLKNTRAELRKRGYEPKDL